MRVVYCAVYPHVCGAALAAVVAKLGQGGLSPRVWGSHTYKSGFVTKPRSIPTCVGQPPADSVRRDSHRVYPHVCGAAAVGSLFHIKKRGLSPRVWGSHEIPVSSSIRGRSIPTCVGQPCDQTETGHPLAVYPHVCGAAANCHCYEQVSKGLSPRVWGSQIRVLFFTQPLRSIPTCVGQPSARSKKSGKKTVYPHVCGAACVSVISRLVSFGLSPRVWGSLAYLRIKYLQSRSIPTCVGQPQLFFVSMRMKPVYPHVCGAASACMLSSAFLSGLSPRVWGSLQPGIC